MEIVGAIHILTLNKVVEKMCLKTVIKTMVLLERIINKSMVKSLYSLYSIFCYILPI